jgi:hypothetical protein
MTDRATPTVSDRANFPNLRAAALWAAIAAAGFVVLATHERGLQGIAGGAVGLFALQACLAFLAGVRLRTDRITLPRPLFDSLPLLVVARRSIPLNALHDLTSAGRFFGFDVVLLTLSENAAPALFGSRPGRLAFFEAVKRRIPDIRIYRAY